MKKLDHILDIITRIMMRIGMIFLCFVIILVVINIIGRTLRVFSISGIVEFVRYGVLVVMSFALARCAFDNGHVVVSVFLDKFPKKTKSVIALIELLIAAIVFFLSAIICFKLIPEAVASHLTTEVYKVPFTIIYAILGFGVFMSGVVFAQKAFYQLFDNFSADKAEKSEDQAGGEVDK